MLVQLTSTYYLDSSLFYFCLPTCVDCQSDTSIFFQNAFSQLNTWTSNSSFFGAADRRRRWHSESYLNQTSYNTSWTLATRLWNEEMTPLLNFRKIWGFTKFSLPDVEEGSKLGPARLIESQISLDLVLLVNSEENAHPLIDETTEIEYWLDLVNWLEWWDGLDCPRLVDLSCYHSFIPSFLHSVSQWVSH